LAWLGRSGAPGAARVPGRDSKTKLILWVRRERRAGQVVRSGPRRHRGRRPARRGGTAPAAPAGRAGVRPGALGGAADREVGWVRCPVCAYVGPSATHTCTAEVPVGDRPPAAPGPGLEQVQEPVPSGPPQSRWPSPGLLRAECCPGGGPDVGGGAAASAPAVAGPAHQLVSPVQGRLAARENRPVLSAVRAASRMRTTGAHWVLLLTTSRESFGSPRSRRAQGLYAVLEQVAARHAVPAEPAGSPC
jgi:hypothetical protein